MSSVASESSAQYDGLLGVGWCKAIVTVRWQQRLNTSTDMMICTDVGTGGAGGAMAQGPTTFLS